jgi:membrane protease subunit HflK
MAEYEIFDPNDSTQKKKKKPNVPIKLIIIGVVVIIILTFLSTGIYSVDASEIALVKTFGKYSHTVEPGINFHLPYPFQTHEKIDVRTIRTIEIGFRSQAARGSNVNFRHVGEEANMITGDENIISIYLVVQYRIVDPVNYYFNVIDDYSLVKFTTESVLRETVAFSNLDDVLTTDRTLVSIQTAENVQKILDEYNAGIRIEEVFLQDVTPPEPVVAAFDDVNNARQDKEKLINEANRYKNEITPRSQGRVQEILREAESYEYEKIAIATGETERFKALVYSYELSSEITKKRMILDSIDKMLDNAQLKIISESGNTLRLLNLDELIGGGSK